MEEDQIIDKPLLSGEIQVLQQNKDRNTNR